MERWVHPVPFRTRKLSTSSPMILHIYVWESRPTPALSSPLSPPYAKRCGGLALVWGKSHTGTPLGKQREGRGGPDSFSVHSERIFPSHHIHITSPHITLLHISSSIPYLPTASLSIFLLYRWGTVCIRNRLPRPTSRRCLRMSPLLGTGLRPACLHTSFRS